MTTFLESVVNLQWQNLTESEIAQHLGVDVARVRQALRRYERKSRGVKNVSVSN